MRMKAASRSCRVSVGEKLAIKHSFSPGFHAIHDNRGNHDSIAALSLIRDWRERARTARYCETELARLCNVGERTLQRYFHGKRTSLRIWLMRRRIQDSQVRLLERGVQIKEVAYATGYATPTNFCRQFKRMCGVTPMEWITAHRKHCREMNIV
jgi:AraC-like DNA-binding protein